MVIGVGEHAFLWEDGGPMVDLNTLIPADSSLTLTYAVAINDSGVIAGFGVPPGVPPEDFEIGHAYILIPCDQDHPGVDGCDYSMADAPTGVAQTAPAVRNTSSRSLPQSLVRRTNRYRIPGTAIGPRD
jgi:hypothetical protein